MRLAINLLQESFTLRVKFLDEFCQTRSSAFGACALPPESRLRQQSEDRTSNFFELTPKASLELDSQR